MDTRLFARWALALIGLAALAGGWVAMLPPDDLLGLPGDHASLRPGARAAEAGRQCREALLQERPGLSAKAISVRSVSLPPGGADPGILRVDGAFRDNLASQPAVWQFTCDVSPTGRLNLRIAPD
jgi:hypothetical protein